MIKYFKNEIDFNDNIENILSNNMDKFQMTLQNGISKIKDEMNAKAEIK
jgi:hypothetical protein